MGQQNSRRSVVLFLREIHKIYNRDNDKHQTEYCYSDSSRCLDDFDFHKHRYDNAACFAGSHCAQSNHNRVSRCCNPTWLHKLTACKKNCDRNHDRPSASQDEAQWIFVPLQEHQQCVLLPYSHCTYDNKHVHQNCTSDKHLYSDQATQSHHHVNRHNHDYDNHCASPDQPSPSAWHRHYYDYGDNHDNDTASTYTRLHETAIRHHHERKQARLTSVK
ncbi:hypothetical protein K402DRAFT_57539 [Aulographum hederae CBS 113979]|uniref:Uncharacterized protein n=1 Tax=Aulographum hederae CBS 113979 TaxID=1176131 RepID=A0A6G1H2R7_9PEZI|nr:hypothetical protein K402DRAFT_57539 [Aulographum hederae CBS 113979]